MFYAISLIIFVIICLCLIGIILLQSSKSGGMGSAMGQQAMGVAFGGEGGDKLLVKITSFLAAGYMILAIAINLLLTPVESINNNDSIISRKVQSSDQIISPTNISPVNPSSDSI